MTLPALIATLLLPLNPGVEVTGYQEAVLRSIVPTPPVVVHVGDQGCITAGHMTWSCSYNNHLTGQNVIEMSPDMADNPTFLHELGHQFDTAVMDDRARGRFLRLIHSPQKWDNGPNEIFATGYSLCARYRTLPVGEDYPTQYSYRPTQRTHRRTCALIRAAASRHHTYTLPG